MFCGLCNPNPRRVTAQEAADLLNVSRPFRVQLLERGNIPYHKAGTHRHVRYNDVIAYKERLDAEGWDALGTLGEHVQALKIEHE
ncbi:excisionase family DNA-binding protein [Marinobacter sp.]|uniref:excisionase family DNA-binding protein n=1 Tax=Marinobacter sp. TaxID=50741 RepID=UPI003A8FEC46